MQIKSWHLAFLGLLIFFLHLLRIVVVGCVFGIQPFDSGVLYEILRLFVYLLIPVLLLKYSKTRLAGVIVCILAVLSLANMSFEGFIYQPLLQNPVPFEYTSYFVTSILLSLTYIAAAGLYFLKERRNEKDSY